MSAERHWTTLGLRLLGLGVSGLACLTACSNDRSPQVHDTQGERPTLAEALDEAALRASALEGLEAAARDDATSVRLGLAAALETDALEDRASTLVDALDDPALTAETERMFRGLQDSEPLRAALVDYARAHPELDTSELSVGFVDHVGTRLTRPELTAALRQGLRRQLRGLDPALTHALLLDAHGARELSARATEGIVVFAAQGQLDATFGSAASSVQPKLERRLADPARAEGLLTALGLWLAEGELESLALELLVSETCTRALAASLTRALADPSLQTRIEALFALALAPSFDPLAFDRALDQLLREPVIAREATAWLTSLARAPTSRAALETALIRFAASPGFESALLDYLG